MTPSDLDLALACAATYEPDAVPRWQDSMRLVHVFLSNVGGVPVVAFEGTHDFQEWLVDFFALQAPDYDHPQLGPVHLGFLRDVHAVKDKVSTYLALMGWPPYAVAGHSKGAGEAILFTLEMKLIGHPPLVTRAFEPPRVGTKQLGDIMAGVDFAWTRTRNVHGNDLVTEVPFGPAWSHVGDPAILIVPDAYDVPTKHRIPAVLEALGQA